LLFLEFWLGLGFASLSVGSGILAADAVTRESRNFENFLG
jgi:hypothetical protein